MKIKMFSVIACLVFSCSLSHAEIKIENLKGIPNAVLLNQDVVGGVTPGKDALSEAQSEGFKSVIDLRAPEEGIGEEKEVVEKMQMKYINIPVESDSLSFEQADRLNEILSRPESTPAILHCASGNRVAALWALYQKKYAGLSSDDAYDLGLEKGLRSENMKETTRRILNEEKSYSR